MGLDQPFMQRAFVAGLMMGVLCPWLGAFVVTRRMAFFGDALAHSAFTGIALGMLMGIDPGLAAIGFAILVALGMGHVQARTRIPPDTVIGVFFSGAAALGILMIGRLRGYRSDLYGYLFGDILTIGPADLWLAGGLLAVVAALLVVLNKPLLQVALNRDFAALRGVRVQLMEYVLMVLLAVTVSVSIRLIGIVLVTALLIVPAAAARNVSASFRQMLGFSVGFGAFSAVTGLFGAYWLNIAAGPAVVLVAVALFVVSLIQPR